MRLHTHINDEGAYSLYITSYSPFSYNNVLEYATEWLIFLDYRGATNDPPYPVCNYRIIVNMKEGYGVQSDLPTNIDYDTETGDIVVTFESNKNRIMYLKKLFQ